MSDLNEKQLEALERVKPICADCKYYDNSDEWSPPSCSRSVASACNVSGRVSMRACHDERNRGFPNSCGKRGQYFEQYVAPPTLFDKVIAWLKS